jgi:hypothetical protein
MYLLINPMKLTTIISLALIASSPIALYAQETVPATPLVPAADANKGSVQEQIEAVTSEFDQKATAFMKKLRAEKDRNKQRKLYKQRPDPQASVDQVITLAKKDLKAAGVEQGLGWCAKKTTQGPQSLEVLDLILTHYNESAVLGSLASNYSRMRGVEELRLMVEKAGNEKVRQGATYYLASLLLKNEATKAEGITSMKGLQATDGLAESNPKLHKQIKSELFIAENLSIGSKAPDIVGKDHEDKEFKLSDYKGQVVLLDFWGIW